MPKTIIISASTANYFPLLDGLLSSLESSAGRDGIDIGVLDLGLDEKQRQNLQQRNVLTVVPPWDYELAAFAEAPPSYFKAMTARPHLPRHFPGYEMYFWLDADSWVQEWEAARLYLATAKATGFACTPECDRSYAPYIGEVPVLEFAFKCFSLCVDEKQAQLLTHFPLINSGIFAARADAPHWQKWSELLGAVLAKRRVPDFYVEQTALNVVVRTGNVATALLPSSCNWMCHRALPIRSADGGKLLEPEPPHQPIGIIHLTFNPKGGLTRVRDTTGASRWYSLRFGGSSVSAPAAPSPRPI